MTRMIAFKQLEKILHRLAIIISTFVALVVPVGFGIDAYMAERAKRLFQAHLAAERIAQFAYVQGPVWRLNEHRIDGLIAFVLLPDDPAAVTVTDKGGSAIFSTEDRPQSLTLRALVPIVAGSETVGTVIVEVSLIPLYERIGILAVIGLMLGGSIYACVHFLPLRALRVTMASLVATQESLRTQIARTEGALQIAEAERYRATESNRLKSEFLANMSHELRTPLNAIIGFSDMMKSKIFGSLNERYLDYSDNIHASGTHLLDIINNILDLAKIEAGRPELDLQLIDLDEMLVGCVRMLQQQALKAGVKLRISPDTARSLTIVADPIKLKQVLLNLVGNAIKFTLDGGQITLSARSDRAGWVEIEVIDTGIGMTEDEIALAFQPFRQIESSHTRNYQGTGLGLTLAKALVELHDGRLLIDSKKGAGTRVIVSVPPHRTVTDANAKETEPQAGEAESRVTSGASNAPAIMNFQPA